LIIGAALGFKDVVDCCIGALLSSLRIPLFRPLSAFFTDSRAWWRCCFGRQPRTICFTQGCCRRSLGYSNCTKLSFPPHSQSPSSPYPFQTLLAKMPPLDPVDAADNTPFQLAIQLRRTEMMQRLIRAGADVKRVTKKGNNMIHEAALHNFPQAFETLVQMGVSPNLANATGNTPLHVATVQVRHFHCSHQKKTLPTPAIRDTRIVPKLYLHLGRRQI